MLSPRRVGLGPGSGSGIYFRGEIEGGITVNTQSLCPVCLQKIPGQYIQEGDSIYLRKECAGHGVWQTLVWQGKPDFFSWGKDDSSSKPLLAANPVERGCPFDCGLCAQHGQAACCVLIEITQRCDQRCPYCFAAAGENSAPPDYTLAEMEELLSFLYERSPEQPFNIQLSGGEPTLHPHLADIIRRVKKQGFTYVQINTNGSRLAAHPEYGRELREAGLNCVYLQFDGLDDAIYRTLRGQDLLAGKLRALENSAAAGLGVVLVMTVVPGVNDQVVGAVVNFAAANLPKIKGLSFQPVSYFGRYPEAPPNEKRLNLAELMQKIETQTGEAIKLEDFSPLDNTGRHCSFQGTFLVDEEGNFKSLRRQQAQNCCDIEHTRSFIARRWGNSDSPNTCCGSSSAYDAAEWQNVRDKLEGRILSISAMAFQDVWNVDVNRLRRCYLHVATKDKRLIPFCAYNITDALGNRLYRGVGRS